MGENDWTSKSQTELDKIWNNFRKSQAWKSLKYLFNKEENIDKTNGVQYMRMLLSFGAPLDMSGKTSIDGSIEGSKYKDITDREREQKVFIADFQTKVVEMIDQFKKDNENGLDVIIFSEAVAQA